MDFVLCSPSAGRKSICKKTWLLSRERRLRYRAPLFYHRERALQQLFQAIASRSLQSGSKQRALSNSYTSDGGARLLPRPDRLCLGGKGLASACLYGEGALLRTFLRLLAEGFPPFARFAASRFCAFCLLSSLFVCMRLILYVGDEE